MNVLPSTRVLVVAVPHQDRRPRELSLRGANVAKQVVADDPVVAGVDVHGIRIVVTARRVVLEYGGPDDAIVDAAAGAIGARLQKLLPRVDEPDVVDERRLRARIQHDRVIEHVADRQMRDRDALHVAAHPDAERHAAVRRTVHAFADQHDVIAFAGGAPDADVGEAAVDVQRRRRLYVPGPIRIVVLDAIPATAFWSCASVLTLHDRAGRRGQRNWRHGRTAHGHSRMQQERRRERGDASRRTSRHLHLRFWRRHLKARPLPRADAVPGLPAALATLRSVFGLTFRRAHSARSATIGSIREARRAGR